MSILYTINTASGATPPAVFVKQYDKGYAIDFKIYNGPEIYDLTGHTVLVNLQKPDNNIYIGIGTIGDDAAEGRVSVHLDTNRQMTAAAGEGLIELVMVKAGKAQATANARWIVQESPGVDVVISESVNASIVDSLITLAADIAGNVDDAEDSKADAAAAAATAVAAAARAEAEANRAAETAAGNLLDVFFPVGSIVQYTDASINPGNLMGGTWERIEGRFLFAADDNHAIGSTGGSETVTLTTANMPAHRHYTINLSKGVTSPDYQHSVARYDKENTSWEDCHYQLNGNSNEANGGRSSVAGSGTAHNNMPPYLAVYMWERTA